MDDHPSAAPANNPAGRLAQHPGTAMLRVLEVCGAANDAFEVAALQLRRLVLALENPDDPRSAEASTPGPEQQQSFQEATQRLLRLLTAVDALLKQTSRAVTEPFVLDSFRHDHAEAERTVFVTDPLGAFMGGFREWMTQKHLPSLTLVKHPLPGVKQVELFLDSLGMLHRGRWDTFARRHLHQYQPRMPLLTVVDIYERKVRTHYHRFNRRFRSDHASDLEAARALAEECYGPMQPPPSFSI